MSTAEKSPKILPSSVVEDDPISPRREPLSDEQLEEIGAMLDDLPVLPEVALRALRLAEDPDWDLRTLDATLRCDQGLAAGFLRLANSAFFGARCTVTKLDRTINLVGITRVRSVLLAAALEGFHECGVPFHLTGTRPLHRDRHAGAHSGGGTRPWNRPSTWGSRSRWCPPPAKNSLWCSGWIWMRGPTPAPRHWR